MKQSKPAIFDLIETLSDELSLESVKELEQEIRKLKYKCIDQEIIQETLLESKRNKEGNICCPFCGSAHIKKNGFNRQHKQVYVCLNEFCDCKNFTATSNSILFSTKKDTSSWIKFLTAYLDKCSLRICADKAKKRGMSNDKINIATTIDSHGNVIMKYSVNGRITSRALLDVFQGFIEEGATVISDSLRSYHRFMKDMKVNWIKIESGKNEKDGHNLEKINHLHDGIKTFLGLFRGVSKHYLQGYLSYFNLFRNYRQYYHDTEFERILVDLFSVPGRLTYKEIINKSFIYA